MLLTVTTTHEPATDLGHLLHKHPDRVQEFSQSFGTATVLYPEATEQRCTAALLLDVDPVKLARSRGRRSPDFSLSQYVNDRPYAASSLLAGALGDVFSTARSGICKARQELADTAIPLEVEVPVLPCRGGSDVARRLLEPLGWTVDVEPIPLDERFPEWGDSRYVRLHLTGTLRLADALNQLYVLLPVLDESKHYWQASDEVDKLLRSGGSWLASHPERDLLVRRYLSRRSALARVALARLAELDDVPEESDAAVAESEETDVVGRTPLNHLRRDAVVTALGELEASSVLDLGCGSGQLLSVLLKDPRYRRVTGVDVSTTALQHAARRLRVEDMSERQSERLQLLQGALTYVDERIRGYDAAVLMEVIEHVDPSRLVALERSVFGAAAPGAVIVTTPNADYNVNYELLEGMRHPDHRFEWTRAEFAAWCDSVCATYAFTVDLRGVGELDETLGAPTQMGIFRRG